MVIGKAITMRLCIWHKNYWNNKKDKSNSKLYHFIRADLNIKMKSKNFILKF